MMSQPVLIALNIKLDQICVFYILLWSMSYLLTWRRLGLCPMLQPATEGWSRKIGLTSGELSCRPLFRNNFGPHNTQQTLTQLSCFGCKLQICFCVRRRSFISAAVCTFSLISSPVTRPPSLHGVVFLPSHLRFLPHTTTNRPRNQKRERERERERENISLIYITRLFQSNMAIHQRGFQWQAITRLPDSSACCLCCCRSLGPPLANSPWKQYLYIYYIFTQYLPRCKTISYLTINSPMFSFSFFSWSCLIPPPPPLLPPYHICLSLSLLFFSSCFLLSSGVFFFFSSSMPQFHFFFWRDFSSLFFLSFFRLVYRWNWIFLLSHGGQSQQQLPSHSKSSTALWKEEIQGEEL